LESAIMMRVALVLGSIGTMAAIELATPPRTASAVHESPVAQTSAGFDDSYDTLTEADRLEPYRYAKGEASTPPVSSDPPTSSVDSPPPRSQESQRTRRHLYSAKKQKVAVVPPKLTTKPTTNSRTSTKHSNSDREEAVVAGHKPCRQNALDSLLKLLSLSRGCET
jgi:hypothetical protein